MAKVRPEQLGWGLTADLAITASGNYFVFDVDGNVYLDFKGVNGNHFEIKNESSSLFTVQDTGDIIVSNNLYIGGNIIGNVSGSITTALTASHLEEQNVVLFRPIETPQMFVTGGFFRSSSGDWFLS
jgi:hypothetical protein